MKSLWKKDEIPYCELKRVVYPKKPGDPFQFIMTPRGQREYGRREHAERRLAKRKTIGAGLLWNEWLFHPWPS